MLFYRSTTKVQKINAVELRRWAKGPLFLLLFFRFYRSAPKCNTLSVIVGGMTISWRKNFKRYYKGQPKARVRRHFDRG